MRLHHNAKTCPASRRLMCQRIVVGWSVADAALAAGISERRAREWYQRWCEGDRQLQDLPSVARSITAGAYTG